MLTGEPDAGNLQVRFGGRGGANQCAIPTPYLEPDIAGVTLIAPPATHQDDSAPALLGVLRVCDIPDVIGMLAPRPVTLSTLDRALFHKTQSIYDAAGATGRLTFTR